MLSFIVLNIKLINFFEKDELLALNTNIAQQGKQSFKTPNTATLINKRPSQKIC